MSRRDIWRSCSSCVVVLRFMVRLSSSYFHIFLLIILPVPAKSSLRFPLSCFVMPFPLSLASLQSRLYDRSITAEMNGVSDAKHAAMAARLLTGASSHMRIQAGAYSAVALPVEDPQRHSKSRRSTQYLRCIILLNTRWPANDGFRSQFSVFIHVKILCFTCDHGTRCTDPYMPICRMPDG